MIRLALIGYGYWGPNYARILNELPECDLVGCAEICPSALARVQERLPGIETTADYRQWLDRDDLHGFIVATPAGLPGRSIRNCRSWHFKPRTVSRSQFSQTTRCTISAPTPCRVQSRSRR